MANFNGQMQACGSGQQTYYKITVDFGHVNATNSAIQIDITNDVTSGVGCTWGFK
jgi:spore maturation protein SpmB